MSRGSEPSGERTEIVGKRKSEKTVKIKTKRRANNYDIPKRTGGQRLSVVARKPYYYINAHLCKTIIITLRCIAGRLNIHSDGCIIITRKRRTNPGAVAAPPRA